MKRIIYTIPVLLVTVIAMTLAQPEPGKAELPDVADQLVLINAILKNHEARLTNSEADLKELQSSTNTSPSTTRVIVEQVDSPPVTTPATDVVSEPPASKPEPVSKEKRVEKEGGMYYTYCDYTYPDGSTETKFIGKATSEKLIFHC